MAGRALEVQVFVACTNAAWDAEVWERDFQDVRFRSGVPIKNLAVPVT